MLEFLNRRFEEVLGGLILAVMACIAFINVIIRYCTTLSFSASEELTVNLFVWIVLLGTACAFRESSNFTMNVLYSCTHGLLRKFLYFFSLVCCIAFFGCLIYLGSLEVLDEIELNASSESLNIPVWLYTIATPLFSTLIIFRILQRTCEDIRLNRF